MVTELKKKVERLLATADEGKMIQEGIKTVIVGKPNAGKSSLLNLLVGRRRPLLQILRELRGMCWKRL